MEATRIIMPIHIRAPYTSQKGPIMRRNITVPVTPAMEEVHMSSFFKFRDSWTSPSSGVMAYQMKKPTKKPILNIT